MKRQRRPILLRLPSSKRREPLLNPRLSFSEVAVTPARHPFPRTRMRGGKITKVHVAEAVGSTAAECAAVCCCCPCGIVNLIVLVAYRVPASLCRKACLRRRQRRLIKKGLLPPKGRRPSCKDEEGETRAAFGKEELVLGVPPRKKDEFADRLEKEMWERFYNSGFWRSPSQREQQNLQNNKTENQNQ